MAIDYYDIIIRKKQSFARQICKNPIIQSELCDQIEICEDLKVSLSDTEIEELSRMSLVGMQNWLHNLKMHGRKRT
nr:MAG TPA: hypothetical protein [Bacteriophage sp.]